MSPSRAMLRSNYLDAIARMEATSGQLPGIVIQASRSNLVEQLIDSKRRSEYFTAVSSRSVSPERADPHSSNFDPILASKYKHDSGETDEAWWLLFLYVHFGKHEQAGWRYSRNLYAGGGTIWTWERVSGDLADFRRWLSSNQATIQGNLPRGFGNHRKRESTSDSNTGRTIATFVELGASHGRLTNVFSVPRTPTNERFDTLYDRMESIFRFGRTARFDFLVTAHQLDFINAPPMRTYLVGATGPRTGAAALFGESTHARSSLLEDHLSHFGDALQVPPNVVEDAVCNWQKSPTRYQRFRG